MPTMVYDPKEFEAAVDYVTQMNPYAESRADVVKCLQTLIEGGQKRGRHWSRCGGFVLTFAPHEESNTVDVGIYVQALFHGTPSKKTTRRTAWDHLKDDSG